MVEIPSKSPRYVLQLHSSYDNQFVKIGFIVGNNQLFMKSVSKFHILHNINYSSNLNFFERCAIDGNSVTSECLITIIEFKLTI